MTDYFRPENPRDVFVVTACTGKFSYDSPQVAWRQLKRQAKKRKLTHRAPKGGSNEQRPYRCRVCGKWHIGSAR